MLYFNVYIFDKDRLARQIEEKRDRAVQKQARAARTSDQ